MPTFQYKKLIRDNIWGWHEKRGHTVEGKKVQGAELIAALCEKLHEEADEVKSALNREELIEEIADVREILDELCTQESISQAEITEAQQAKREHKGGFTAGNYIDTVRILDEDDEWVAYCRKNPEKYPEVDSDGMVNPDLPTIEKGAYRHNKSGNLYEVLGVALDSEQLSPLVIYAPQYNSKYELCARPYDMFIETVELDGKSMPRFEKIND